MNAINKNLNKKYIFILLIVGLVSFLGVSGMRLTPLGALKATSFVKGDIEILATIDALGGKIYIIDTPEAFQTVYIDQYGPFWVSQCAFHTMKDDIKDDPLKMIGVMNYSKNPLEQVQLLGIWNEDPQIEVIQIIREDGIAYIQPAPSSELILFQWDKVNNLSALSILALDKDSNPIYYYGYPKGAISLRGSEFKWHPIMQGQ